MLGGLSYRGSILSVQLPIQYKPLPCQADVEMVRLLQRHTLNLVHRFLCGGEGVNESPYRRRLVPRYLDAVTDLRMVILARSRYKMYSRFSGFQV